MLLRYLTNLYVHAPPSNLSRWLLKAVNWEISFQWMYAKAHHNHPLTRLGHLVMNFRKIFDEESLKSLDDNDTECWTKRVRWTRTRRDSLFDKKCCFTWVFSMCTICPDSSSLWKRLRSYFVKRPVIENIVAGSWCGSPTICYCELYGAKKSITQFKNKTDQSNLSLKKNLQCTHT